MSSTTVAQGQESDRTLDALHALHRVGRGAIFVVSRGGQFLCANPATATLLGIDPKDPEANLSQIGWRWRPTEIDPNQTSEFAEPWRTVLEAGQLVERSFTVVLASGEQRILRVAGVPLFDQAGEVELASFSITDVSEQVEAERERIYYLEFLEALPDPIGIADAEGRVLYHNQAMRGVSGGAWDTAGAQRRHIQEILEPESAERMLNEGLPTAARQGIWRGETRVRCINGELLTLSQTVIGHRDADGGVKRYSTLIHDVTSHLLEKEGLRRLHAIDHNKGGSLHQKIEQLLDLGRKISGLSWGALLDLEPGAHAVRLRTGGIPASGSTPLHPLLAAPERLCAVLRGRSAALVKNDLSVSSAPPLSKHSGAGALIAYPLWCSREGMHCKAIAFAAAEPRAPFSAFERDIIGLIAQRIGADLNHAHYEHYLERERSLFRDGPAVVFRWASRSGRDGYAVEYVSANVEQTFGYTRAALMAGVPAFVDLIHPADRARVTAELEAASRANKGHLEHAPYRLRRADGHYRWVYDSTVIHRRADHSVEAYHGYLIDLDRLPRPPQTPPVEPAAPPVGSGGHSPRGE